MMKYDRQIRVRGRPWYQTARRVSLGYELDPAENRGFILIIPAYMVLEEVVTCSSLDQSTDGDTPSFISDLRVGLFNLPGLTEPRQELPA
ncbi:MAG: hypothetical protein HY314_13190 [Acidobacteria bacterium]|nr:hypothetical protein [Acidobacteriota bacterium]